jgi:hypothetical protein
MRLHLIAGALLLLASACTTPADRSGAPAFGEAVSTNTAAQTIPSTPSMEPPEGSGAQGEGAITRYHAGQPRELAPSSTSSANPSSSGN